MAPLPGDMHASYMLNSAGCTCGAAAQLKVERDRLVSDDNDCRQRAASLASREAQLDCRTQQVEAAHAEALLSKRQVQEYSVQVDNKLSRKQWLAKTTEQREQSVRSVEEELQRLAEAVQEKEREADAQEDAVAQEELQLMEERNIVEDELQRIREQRSLLDSESLSIAQECEALRMRLDDIEGETNTLDGEDMLQDELELHIDPINRRLVERERRLNAKEMELRGLEEECDERECKVVPECRRSIEAYKAAQDRAAELKSREEGSELQLEQLLQRLRDLCGTDIRLSGLEGALQWGVRDIEFPDNLDGMRDRLDHLRGVDADWSERVRQQQAEVVGLEAQVEALKRTSRIQKRTDCMLKRVGIR